MNKVSKSMIAIAFSLLAATCRGHLHSSFQHELLEEPSNIFAHQLALSMPTHPPPKEYGKGKGTQGKGKGKGNGNGKGKGGGKGVDAIECEVEGEEKGSKKGKSSKQSQSKRNGMNGCKKAAKKWSKSVGKGKGAAMVPTTSPVATSTPTISPASYAPMSAPTFPGTPPPTGVPKAFALPKYTNYYTIEQFRIPVETEYEAVNELTQGYLNSFFTISYENSNDYLFIESSTMLTNKEFIFGQPVKMDFNTTVVFSTISDIASEVPEPPPESVLKDAFEGENLAIYISLLDTGLPTSNIFSTTTAVEFKGAPDFDRMDERIPSMGARPSSMKSTVNNIGQFSATASVASGVLLLAGLTIYCRRRRYSENKDSKGIDDCDDHTTLAGETYEGSSVD